MRGKGVGELTLRQYPLWRRGKVRDIFDAGDRLVFVASDRVSAFDVVLPSLLAGKGRILTEISRFWFDATSHLCPNHVVAYDTVDLDLSEIETRQLEHRVIQVRRAERIDIECVVRARLAGSGWAEYQRSGTLAAESLPDGMSIGDQLPEPRFTPAIKNDSGHDENISRAQLRNIVGKELAQRLEEYSLSIFGCATGLAASAGFILADTKFEFGNIDGELTLIDEALTPDSSRYWEAATIHAGAAPPGYDKQVIRDWLVDSGWDKQPPAPSLPIAIIDTALERYTAVRDRLLSTQIVDATTGAKKP